MSPFVVLFATALLSFGIHNIKLLRAFGVVALSASIVLALLHYTTPLQSFESSSAIRFFEVVLFIVLFATLFSLETPIALTQTLFIAAASVLLLESDTLLSFVISFEALSIISFVLVSFIRTQKEAAGAVKMFISGSLATGIILLGSALYLLSRENLNAPLATSLSGIGTIGIWILLLGVFYKLTIVPMHIWAAESYAQVRPAYAALLSGVVKSVVAVAVFKTFAPFIAANTDFSLPLLLAFAVITMTLGNFLALFAKKVDKVLAYSSIAHAGYMLLAFGAVESAYAPTALLYMATAYIFMQTALFLLLDRLSDGKGNLSLEDLKGLAKKDKLAALFFTIQLFSLAGIPLLGGFLAKAVLIYALVDANFIFIALFTLLNSALSVGYYIWIIKHIYFDTTEKENSLKSPDKAAYLTQIILLGGTLFFGIFASLIFNLHF